MQIESPAFVHQQFIPQEYTCQGADISPPLIFRDVPKEAISLVLIVDDPDAPGRIFVHWLAWNIPADAHHLPSGERPSKQGKNDFGTLRYGGPCPPPGKPHRYFFKLYAIDTLLNLANGASKKELESALDGHVVDQAELIGLFQR